ncbi:hypothetical protein Tco_0719310, partial [Tanacetum coccineum]
IVARRANECIVSIIEPDYKNLNKNDIEDMYLLIMNGKVLDYAEIGLLWSLSVFIRSSVIWERVHDFQLGIESYQQKVNLTAPTISFSGVEKHKMFSIIFEPVHGIIYKNSKKEKRVMRHSEIHKFCDATLNRVLEGLKSDKCKIHISDLPKMSLNDPKQTKNGKDMLVFVCSKKATWKRESTRRMEIYIEFTLRSNTSCHITDYHAGNPCVHKLDQTAKIKAPMIGKWMAMIRRGMGSTQGARRFSRRL